ncbi:MAG: general secretion pathway protein GspK [Gammaproteobacteria bacterium]|nr:general secretion pathway protein GspK [Gammaproteobacteria bacterium]
MRGCCSDARMTRIGNRGFILVAVLWLLALLTVLAGAMTYSSRQATRSMASLVGAAQARHVADGAVQLALLNLLSRTSADRLLADGETLELALPGGQAVITVTDESGRIDLNRADSTLLARLLLALDLGEDRALALADAVVDYRDTDMLRSMHGAEDDEYDRAGLANGAKDEPFEDVAELRQVLGFDEAIYQAVRPYVTIYSDSATVNPAVAPLIVLRAISDETEGILQDYIDQRRQNHRDKVSAPSLPGAVQRYAAQGNQGGGGRSSRSSRGSRGTSGSAVATGAATYTLSIVAYTEDGRRTGMTTTVTITRNTSQPSVRTLDLRPYAELPARTSADQG